MSRQPAPGDGSGSGRVALIQRRGKFLVAEPFFSPGVRLAVSRDSRYGVGDLVVIASADGGRRSGRGGGQRVRVVRRLGRPGVARDVIEALMVDRGLARSFERQVAHAASETASSRQIEAGRGRRDLRSLPTFTIDPATARDFDDAVSARALDGGGGWSVWVHIADVSAYVRPRDPVDREAFRRGTSVYVPGAVEPMLPTELSNGVCSLVPGQDRLAVTVEMVVRAGSGEVVSVAFHRSLIRSDRRLTYGQVDALFEGRDGGLDTVPGLAAARAAAAALAERPRGGRTGAGSGSALVLDSEEPEFSFDRAGNVTEISPIAQTESHRLIEHLMIAANEQVARFLEAHRVPTLYRVHERPEAAAVERMLDRLAALGVPTPAIAAHGSVMTSQQAADVAVEASALVAEWVRAHDGRGARALNRIVLRSLKQAYYDPVQRGHSGLGLASYCHFTSPIRRYPDLICHRALLSALGGTEPAPESSWVASAGPATSAAERRAMTIERDADDVARCFLLESRLANAPGGPFGPAAVFEGEIVGVIGAGAFVAFGERGEFEGLLPVRRMRDDWWELDEHETALIGVRHGGALRLGDPVKVRVDGIDAPRGRVDLVPVARD